MRKTLLASLALGLMVGAAGIAMTSSSLRRASGNQSASRPLNPAHVADRQMIAFGEAHPGCPLWTNWEKLCSRTGPEGGVHCQIDPGRRVRPSRPFCARSEGSSNMWPTAQRVSIDRYCLTHGIIPDPLEPGRSILVCARWDPHRPFNGRRVAALLQPGCGGLSVAESGRQICGDHASAGRLPECASLAAAGYEHPRLLECTRWTGNHHCHAFPIRGAPDSGEAISIPRDADTTNVHGLYFEPE
jgi:hypothetical protein